MMSVYCLFNFINSTCTSMGILLTKLPTFPLEPISSDPACVLASDMISLFHYQKHANYSIGISSLQNEVVNLKMTIKSRPEEYLGKINPGNARYSFNLECI